tara:strand:+ start:252 stop:530 length:279 start_codon:yes stop_codon:yes gene_type:complete
MSRKWRCRLRQTFFGLTDEYSEGVYEQIFFLKYSGGWSFSEAYSLPIGLREWFVKRLIKQLEMEKEAIEKASSGRGKSQELTPFNQPFSPKM